MKLISMVEFVLEQGVLYSDSIQFRYAVNNYANFLKQPLKLEMFIPCVDGEPIEDPELTMRQGNGFTYYGAEDKDFDEYGKAEEKVLFEGAEIRKDTYKSTKRTFVELGEMRIYNGLLYYTGKEENKFKLEGMTIEDLIPYDLTLTETAKKKILG